MMEASRRLGRRVLWALGLLFMWILGCNTSPYDSTVSGTVTLDGAPLDAVGNIQFVPVDRSHNPATGPIEPDGSYEVFTGNQPGLRPGEYDVVVAIYKLANPAPGERAPVGSSKLLTPEKYASLETTDLRFTVRPGHNVIDIPITSKGG